MVSWNDSIASIRVQNVEGLYGTTQYIILLNFCIYLLSDVPCTTFTLRFLPAWILNGLILLNMPNLADLIMIFVQLAIIIVVQANAVLAIRPK